MINSKFWQAFFALAPIIIFIVAFFGYLFFVFSILGNLREFEDADVPPMELLAGIGTFVITILFAVIISLGSLIFYIVHAVQNPNLRENNLLLVWILLFIFANGIGQLIYWIIEIVNKRQQNLVH
ncbi:MAG: hypothetical protein E4H26_12390 [Flavobacteriales bacterium]|nr:MAG: hypothetical protein E4H26_12390 [Flavobacteriales bacterium]